MSAIKINGINKIVFLEKYHKCHRVKVSMVTVATDSYIRDILAVAIAHGERQKRREAIIERAVLRVNVDTIKYTSIMFRVPRKAVGNRKAHSS